MTNNTALHDCLRQILAVLEAERQAIAGIDLDAITIAAQDKSRLCDRIEGIEVAGLDDESVAMLMAARNANETNRQMRNLVAANIAQRLDMLTGSPQIYGARHHARFRG